MARHARTAPSPSRTNPGRPLPPAPSSPLRQDSGQETPATRAANPHLPRSEHVRNTAAGTSGGLKSKLFQVRWVGEWVGWASLQGGEGGGHRRRPEEQAVPGGARRAAVGAHRAQLRASGAGNLGRGGSRRVLCGAPRVCELGREGGRHPLAVCPCLRGHDASRPGGWLPPTRPGAPATVPRAAQPAEAQPGLNASRADSCRHLPVVRSGGMLRVQHARPRQGGVMDRGCAARWVGHAAGPAGVRSLGAALTLGPVALPPGPTAGGAGSSMPQPSRFNQCCYGT